MHNYILALFLAAPLSVWAHGGGLDASGCHTKRATGEYHCHGAGRVAQAPKQQPGNAYAAPAPAPGGPNCYTGPRGGRYTISPSGRKNYGGC